MSGVKLLFVCYAMLAGVLLRASEPCRIFLDPAAECGAFIARKGVCSLSEPSRIRLSYNKDGIVLEASLYPPPGKKFSCKGKKNDDMALFGGSVFEFQLAPPAQKGVYYHFALSPSRWMYTAKKQDMKWEGMGVQYVSKCIPEKEWRFTLTVPFRSLGEKPPRKGDVWRFHMGKSVETAFEKVEHSSISGARDYHKVEQYGFLVFGKKAPLEQSMVLSQIVPRGKNYTFYFRSENKADPGTLYYSLADSSHGGVLPLQKSRQAGLQEVTFSPLRPGGVMPLKENIALSLCIRRRNNDVLYRGNVSLSVKELSSVSLDRFYYTPSDPGIRYTHTLPGKCRAVVKRGGNIVHTEKNVSCSGTLSFAKLKLAPGRYVFEVTDGLHAVQQLFFVLKSVPALPPLKKGVGLEIRKDRTFSMGGESLYLLGLSRARVAIPYKSVFNFSYNPAGARENAVVMPGMPGGKLVRKPFTGRIYGDDSQYLKRLADYVCKWKDGKRGVFHLLSYEASIPAVVRDSGGKVVPGSPADLLKRAYRTAKSLAENSLFSIHVDRANQIPFYAASCDIFQCALYSSSYGEDMIPCLEKDLEKLRIAVPDKPLIYWLGGTIPHYQYRIAEEIRCGVYLSILKGMAGNIIHMGHAPMPLSRTRMWSLLGGLPVEIEGFYKDFASGETLDFSLEKESPFAAAMRKLPGGGRILIVVNTKATEERLSLPGDFAREIRIYGTQEKLALKTVKNTSWTGWLLPEKKVYEDSFCGYEPKVYYLKD